MSTRSAIVFGFVLASFNLVGCVIKHDGSSTSGTTGHTSGTTASTNTSTSTTNGTTAATTSSTTTSTNGTHGTQGTNGTNGTVGTNGTNGTNGTHGTTNGTVGTTGTIGTTSTTGVTNTNGTTGTTGTTSGQNGNINVYWHFTDGNTCTTLSSQVASIQIVIPGQALANNGIYPCETSGTQGIQLQDFTPQSYTVEVSALDSGNNVLYSGSGTAVVNGDVSVDVPLAPSATLLPGNIDFIWSFSDGNTCSTLGSSVGGIQISIPGQVLANNGYYPCETTGVQGIELQNFAGGDYSATIQALDSTGTITLYQGTGTFEVNGNVTVTMTLSPVNTSGPGTLQIRWSFLDANQDHLDCAAAGVDNVQVTIGPYAPEVVPCSANGVDGADFSNLPAATYDVSLQGLEGSPAFTAFTFDQSVPVGGTTTILTAYLSPLYGSWDLSYNFDGAASCASAGVSSVTLSVTDSQGNEISGQNPTQPYPCGDVPNNLFSWSTFLGGDVTIQMTGYDSGGTALRGVLATTTLYAGAANSTTVTLELCGTTGSGC